MPARTLAEPARKLRTLWLESGITQAELAERSGMHHKQISRLLTGRIPNPTIGTVTTVLRSLGKSLSDYESS